MTALLARVLPRRKLPFLAAIPALVLAGTLAFAEKPHVVILGPSADHLAVVRMRGELSVLGIDVDVLLHAKRSADLEAIARRLGAVAALRVETSPPAIVLWVDPAVAPPGVAPEVRVAGPAEEKDPGLMALRAVEVLRARLVKVPLAVPPPPLPEAGDELAPAEFEGGPPDAEPIVDAAPPDAVPEPVVDAAPPMPPLVVPDDAAPPPRVERTHTAGFSAAPAMMLSPGGVSPSFEVRIGAGWDPIPRLGIEAMAFIPVTPGSATGPMASSVDVRALALGGGLRGILTDPSSPFSVALGLGVDAMMLWFSGTGTAPLVAQSGSFWGVAPYLSATAAYRLHPIVSLRLDTVAAIVRPEPVFRVAGREVPFGLPSVLPSVGVEVRP